MKSSILLIVIFALLVPCLAQESKKPQSSIKSNSINHAVLFPIDVNFMWGFINIKGEVVIKPQYSDADIFSEGLAPVKSKRNGNYGYINTKGKVVIPFKFDDARPFTNGLAQIRQGIYDEVGLIDKTGKILIKPQFRTLLDFHEGLALARTNENEKWGYVNLKGEWVIKPQFEFAEDFSEGLAAVGKDDKIGFIDRTGKFVIPPEFYNARSFSEGLAPVQLHKISVGIWGYIDKTGKLVIDDKYYEPTPFQNGLAIVRTSKGKICINKKGEQVDKLGCNQFSEGLIPVSGINNKGEIKDGFMDESGKIVIAPQWDEVTGFKDGLAAFVNFDRTRQWCGGIHVPGRFYVTDACGYWGYIDKTGKVIWQQEYKSQ